MVREEKRTKNLAQLAGEAVKHKPKKRSDVEVGGVTEGGTEMKIKEATTKDKSAFEKAGL